EQRRDDRAGHPQPHPQVAAVQGQQLVAEPGTGDPGGGGAVAHCALPSAPTSTPFPAAPLLVPSMRWPVACRKTSSSDGWRRVISGMAIPASAKARTMFGIADAPSFTKTWND